MTFAERLENLIDNKGISKKEFSENIGISQQAFYDWKKRNSVPSADIAVKIARLLNVSVEYLVTGEETNIYMKENSKLKNKLDRIVKIALE